MKLRQTALAVLVAVAATACAGEETTGPASAPDVALGGAGGGATVTGDHVVRSRVVGVDSAGGVERLTPLSGVSVRIVLLTRAGGDGADTSAVIPARTHVGTVRSAADGRIELREIPAGYYALEATPPASVPYRGGTGFAESLPATNSFVGLIYLYRR